MKKHLLIPIIALSLTVTGCSIGGAKETDSTALAAEEEVVPVETFKIAKSQISKEILYSGQAKPVEQLSVTPKLGGKVTLVNYDIGDHVNKNDVLFVIDGTDIQSSINAASAQYDASLSAVESAKTSLESVSGAQSESTIQQLQTAVKNAELAIENTNLQIQNAQLALDNVKTTYDNGKVMLESGIMPKAEFDKLQLGYDQAVAGLEAAQLAHSQAEIGRNQALDALNLYIGKTKGSAVKQAQSGVNQASAAAEATKVQLDNAKRNMDDLTVVSPIAGIVTARNVNEGIITGPGTPAFTIIDMSSIEISVSVSEDIINSIKPQMTVPVYIKSISEQPYQGVISTINPSAEEMKNTYPVKILIDNKDEIIKPGMFAEVHFTKEKNESAIVLPRNTVVEEDETKCVFVDVEGRAVKRIVTTGIDNGENIEILSGLNENDNVIVKGQTKVVDGSKIKVVNGNQ